jgi:hypothetical protein
MKILYLGSTAAAGNYLTDSLLQGLRLRYGADVIDFPKCELMYRSCPAESRRRLPGGGFTLYTGLLEDLPLDRVDVEWRVRRGEFDLVVIADIWNAFGWFVQLRPWLRPKDTILIDGSDSPRVYPYSGRWLRRPDCWFLPKADEFLYFKREWTEESRFSLLPVVAPAWAMQRLPAAANLRRTSFSIPPEKIVAAAPRKTKDFPVHIVDEELSARVAGSRTSYAFDTEWDYYADLQSARFGITTKRAGWDCLRHYEIAANGAVPCFRALDSKPETCAPHGLDATNTIIYRDADELLRFVARLTDAEYASLQANALTWARENSSVARADEVIAAWQRASGRGST